MKIVLRFLVVLFPAFYCLCAGAQLPRQQIIFDSGWRFHSGNAADPNKDFNYGHANIFSKSGKAEHTAIDKKFNDSDWQSVQLPHDWSVALPFVHIDDEDVMAHGYKAIGAHYPENSVGWYRKHFFINKADTSRRISLRFDGVYRNSKVWINGFYLGTNASGYLGFTYDISDFINYGGDNVVVVRADAEQWEGWFYEGTGIYRNVWLCEYDKVHVVDNSLFVHSEINKGSAKVYVEVDIENNSLAGQSCAVSAYITDRAGKVVAKMAPQKLTLGVNEVKTMKVNAVVANPHLWNLDDPYLYRAVVIVTKNGKTIDSLQLRTGIRTITFDSGKGLFVNGKSVKVHGVNCHQDHAGVGTALPDYLQYYRIRLLKDMGANAYRTSHYAPTPELLDACDSLGMLVLDEQRLLNSGAEYLSQFERLLKRDRSRACVFLWSIGNEEGYIQWNTYGKRIAQTLLAKQQELDPTRTSTYAADMANVFHGVNEVIPVRGFNYRQYAVDSYHADHPWQPIVGTEMGSTVTTRGVYITDTINGYVPDEDITAPWWASTAEQWWTLCARQPWWMGGFVWTGFDYRGEPTPYEWPDINSNFGVMDMCGFPKNIYYYYQSWWTDKDVLHISPHWNWKGKEGKPIDVWVNSNAQSVELFLNGKSLGKKDMPVNRHLQWVVNYEPGILKAIGYKNGRRLTQQIETTEAPFELVVTPSKTTVVADGRDATVLNISVIDKQGREVPDAANLVHFSLTGDAHITGVGNGDPSSHERDQCDSGKWQRKLFGGKCQVIVQAGYNASEIKIEASGEGLYPASTTVLSIHPGMAHNAEKASGAYKIPANKGRAVRGNIIGADISFLQELENKGEKFSDNGVERDAIEILKSHGFNYIRLRVFYDPARDSGYSPGKGFCDLQHTMQMAKRVKAAGMKFLLDIHYSDYWADPQQQYMPKAWRGEGIDALNKSVFDYTRSVIAALKDQGTAPDMVQVGNEINHGMIWPVGNIGNMDSLAELLCSGIAGVKSVDPDMPIMLHIALGGQNDESRFFLDNMVARNVPFDIIGLSYYPRWHGTLDDLRDNLNDLSNHYDKDVIVVEYSHRKKEVNDIIFNMPNGRGKGAFIWEPLSTWDDIFDRQGHAKDNIRIYDEVSRDYGNK